MKKFKLLIIGNANHQYILNFSKWLRTVIPNISIIIVSFHPIKDETLAETHFDNYFEVPINSKIISKIKGFNSFYLGWKLARIISKNKLRPNTILVHFSAPPLAYVAFWLKRKTSNYIVALWGSDFYRVSRRFYLANNLRYADNIIIGSPQMIEDFKIKFPSLIKKVDLCYYGNEPIEILKNFKELNITKQQSCKHFNLLKDKINITVGHTGSRAHQHISVLNELGNLTPHIKRKIRVILPMTYGLDKEYFNEIKSICEKSSFEYVIFTDFMTEKEVAHLRNLTDIMINLQTTDALSGSMREVLYSKGIVINGSWLPYSFLKELGIYFEEVNFVQKISEKIEEVVLNFSVYKEKCKENAAKIYEISSWSRVIYQWKEVIEPQR